MVNGQWSGFGRLSQLETPPFYSPLPYSPTPLPLLPIPYSLLPIPYSLPPVCPLCALRFIRGTF
ncbi:hypothetical protein H6G89_12370 [Oscillatoria sp. FACHB-1407]|uniref:hypothetical protein n=1 Tax=Oscillatoria sp. FACHB-1407 TaxID=2692847 RepID=UPI00168657E4|nr:hypothetical protein [Oscillatoria sp. FACHB-1407]MBD2461843.1 hypothetical protein [Oscillatoria sp. FACHB-1407]